MINQVSNANRAKLWAALCATLLFALQLVSIIHDHDDHPANKPDVCVTCSALSISGGDQAAPSHFHYAFLETQHCSYPDQRVDNAVQPTFNNYLTRGPPSHS